MSDLLLNDKRAWIEISYKNLENNIREIKRVISPNSDIMAIVKANAYGHGMIQISKMLNKIGINSFAVATLSEGIKLRENNIKGDILILGYTGIKDIEKVIEYDLTQTIVDFEYAEKISKLNIDTKLKAHIKINTGMNRIGESYKNIDNIIKMYRINNIQITGIYTHLCAAESKDEKDVEFTSEQISKYDECIQKIRKLGINPGKTHIQNSYGILNYPKCNYDYVRPGIIMYGAYCDDVCNITRAKVNIKPVLSLKAQITAIKDISKGESVSYDRTFLADRDIKIATVSIGYADGYPRNLSGKGAKVLVNGKLADIIGKICMDQLMIDVTDIPKIKQGDTVTLIGEEKEIAVEQIARKAETITNEIFSRLGDRLERIEV